MKVNHNNKSDLYYEVFVLKCTLDDTSQEPSKSNKRLSLRSTLTKFSCTSVHVTYLYNIVSCSNKTTTTTKGKSNKTKHEVKATRKHTLTLNRYTL